MMELEPDKTPLILIVDDIPKNLQLLGTTLRDEGYKIAALNDPLQVLSSVRNLKPDLILLDVMMPEKDGFEVCKELKGDPDLAEIPVIFLTAKAEQENINFGLELGGADYVTKPFNSSELLARVETHVSLKMAKDQLRKQNNQLEDLIATRDRLYAVIGHDLRGPLNGITGLTRILLEDFEKSEPDPKIGKFISMIHQSSKDVWMLLSDLLNWARMQSGELMVQKEEVSSVKLINNVLELMEYQLTKKDMNINLKYEQEHPIFVDERYIATILRNILSNAIKFSEPGADIDISLQEGEAAYTIAVTDYGIGMDEETIDSLFSSKFHPRNKNEINKNGSGFGLMLSHQLAKIHNCKLEVVSKLGEGTTITLTIPVPSPEDAKTLKHAKAHY
ncbi:two-component system, unclassified family, sensor histidine kinase and response regulator [Gracilimonas mengyeensis]|uniref:histidine kinase n=2 Tax=Gracilimonas mengyeensis TaxID=1302730 RepID=A0A521B0P6_9BACT|nr:two-component system, unclassified family, sensor histidine kinase and response regulator [Gracilimonas mengyeensis]